MFVYKNDEMKKPVKIWLNNINDIEKTCLEQAINLSNLPFIYKHIALMPDTHTGYGMPIGGVIATQDVIIPNAVGVDIGCGMIFMNTQLNIDDLNEGILQLIVNDINKVIPTGFNKHNKKQECITFNNLLFNNEYEKIFELQKEFDNMNYQIGTLGGGNHFIELQKDEENHLCIMIHSGSRNFGYKVANYFNIVAQKLNQKWYSSISEKNDLAFLPIDTKEGKDYIYYMNTALSFAKENRMEMLDKVVEIIEKHTTKISFYDNLLIDVHHNYATLENHFGKNVWVHRKGAIMAREQEIGIIPGAMGSYSYIVKGKGNVDSFNSCSHGAGRCMSRKKAIESFSVEEMLDDLDKNNVILGTNNKAKVVDESRFAYKDIDIVMSNQTDLVIPIKILKTIGVVKGS